MICDLSIPPRVIERKIETCTNRKLFVASIVKIRKNQLIKIYTYILDPGFSVGVEWTKFFRGIDFNFNTI